MATAAQPRTTREALLMAAAERLQAVGWASFSFRDLAETVGIRAASIHHHFPTKADLGVALVSWMRDQRRERERELVSRHPSARARLQALGAVIASHIRECGRSCPIYALQAEYPVLPQPVQVAIVAWIDDVIASLGRWLEEGRRSGELDFPGDPHQQALVVWSVLQQGTQLHRTHPGTDYQGLVNQLIDTISSKGIACPA